MAGMTGQQVLIGHEKPTMAGITEPTVAGLRKANNG